MRNSDLRAANTPTPTGVPGDAERRSWVATQSEIRASQRRLSGRMCECAACGRIFSGLSLFDQHRFWVGQWRGCHDDDWLTEHGYAIRDGRWANPAMTEQQKADRGWA